MSNHYGSVFTYQERKRLRYGTQKQRVGKDSCKKFDCCSLCLHPAVEPLACLEGHLYCKECIYENLLIQKQEIAKKEKLYQLHQQEELKKEQEQRQYAMQALIDEFYATQTGLLPVKKSIVYTSQEAQQEGITKDSSSYTSFTAANGLSFVLDRSAIEQKRKEQQEIALKKLNEGLVNLTAKPGDAKYLPSFWLPSLTPDAKPVSVEPPSQDILCPVGNHTVKLKQLVPVVFVPSPTATSSSSSSSSTSSTSSTSLVKSTSSSSSSSSLSSSSSSSLAPSTSTSTSSLSLDKGQKRPHESDPSENNNNNNNNNNSEEKWICPSCVKTLNNNPKLCVFKTCGHVYCRSCVDRFFTQKKSACTVCEQIIKDPTKDIIDLKSEGTGFAGHGENLVAVKHTVAFQG